MEGGGWRVRVGATGGLPDLSCWGEGESARPTLAVAATSGTACFWCRSAARLAPLASRRMCWSSAMEEVRPLSDSCLCRSTRLRARPRLVHGWWLG